MWTVPTRLIIVLFTKSPFSDAQYATTRDQIAVLLAEQGQRLVDLVVETGPPKRDPSQHPCLLRIAQGEADGVALFAMPARMTPKKSTDVLAKHMTGPLTILSAADLTARRLLPDSTLPPRKSAPPPQLSNSSPPHQPRPLWQAAVLAAELRAKHHSFSAIGKELEAAGFHPPRSGKWHPATVAKLIAQHERYAQQPGMPSGSHPR